MSVTVTFAIVRYREDETEYRNNELARFSGGRRTRLRGRTRNWVKSRSSVVLRAWKTAEWKSLAEVGGEKSLEESEGRAWKAGRQ